MCWNIRVWENGSENETHREWSWSESRKWVHFMQTAFVSVFLHASKQPAIATLYFFIFRLQNSKSDTSLCFLLSFLFYFSSQIHSIASLKVILIFFFYGKKIVSEKNRCKSHLRSEQWRKFASTKRYCAHKKQHRKELREWKIGRKNECRQKEQRHREVQIKCYVSLTNVFLSLDTHSLELGDFFLRSFDAQFLRFVLWISHQM